MPSPGHREDAHPLAGVGARDALKAFNSFPRGSAPGPSRLTARHLCETMRTGSVATSLARILKMIAHGYACTSRRGSFTTAPRSSLSRRATPASAPSQVGKSYGVRPPSSSASA
eukprot:PhM_4_TR1278/c2_g2_i2/m.84623